MPGGDRTGPVGMGPRTGRAAGLCAGYVVPGYANPVPGGGAGRGYGWGRGGWGHGFGGGRGWRYAHGAAFGPGWGRSGGYAPRWTLDSRAERELLRQQAEVLQSELDSIKKHLAAIEAEPASE